MNNKTVSASARAVSSNLFSRKIGNTTYFVSVSFSEKSKEHIEDKILRLAASESLHQHKGDLKCV